MRDIFEEILHFNQTAANQAAALPKEHISIAYLHDAERYMYRFAMVSMHHIADSSLIGEEARYERVSPMIKSDAAVHKEMMQYYLPKFEKRCPDGWLINNPRCAVFTLTYDQAASCLSFLNPLAVRLHNAQDAKCIAEYYTHWHEKTYEAAELRVKYERCCRNLVERYMNANFEAALADLRNQLSENEITISELRQEVERLNEALYQASSVDGYRETRMQIDRELRAKYPLFETEALDSLIDGELLFRVLYGANTCYSAMVIGYAKGFEIQLRKALRTRRPHVYRDGMTLGAVILDIIKERVLPYCNHHADFMAINSWRKPAAHGKSEASDVLAVRKLLFEDRLLEQLFT